MKKNSILTGLVLFLLFSCNDKNKGKEENCIKQFTIIKTTTPSPDVITADLIIENDTLKNIIEKKDYSKVYFQSGNLKMVNWGYGTMIVYYDTIKKLYTAEQEYVTIVEKSTKVKDSIAEAFRKDVVFVLEGKHGDVYQIKKHCY